jgi:hypothetical protein
LSIEHRAAPSRAASPLALQAEGDALALAVADSNPQPATETPVSADERIQDVLGASPAALSVTAIRQACRMRTQAVTACLAELVRTGRAVKTTTGYTLARTA